MKKDEQRKEKKKGGEKPTAATRRRPRLRNPPLHTPPVFLLITTAPPQVRCNGLVPANLHSPTKLFSPTIYPNMNTFKMVLFSVCYFSFGEEGKEKKSYY